MNTILIAIIVILGIILLLALAKRNRPSPEFPYQPTKYLLSKAERSFYGVLTQAAGDEWLVFAKVRVADVLSPRKGLSRSEWQRAFNAVSAKHFDFLLCDPRDCSVKAAVELDDSSHGSAKSQKRDRFLNGACESAKLPLLRIKASKSYVVSDIKHLIQQAITPPQDSSSDAMPIALAQVKETSKPDPDDGSLVSAASTGPTQQPPNTPIAEEPQSPAVPTCPRCGEQMVLRKARSGSHAGQEFWGCITFPKCRGVAKINT